MLFEVVAAHREMILDRAGRNLHDGGDVLDRKVFEIMQDDGGAFLLRNLRQRPAQFFVPEGGVRGGAVGQFRALNPAIPGVFP